MADSIWQGIAASEGIAIGPAFQYTPPNLVISSPTAEDPDHERQRFEEACHLAEDEIRVLRDRVQERVGADSAAIFDAHMMLLADPTLHSNVSDRIAAGSSAEAAVKGATDEIAAMFAALEDEMFAARAADIEDIGRRLLRILLGVPDTSLASLQEPSIIVAHDLTPSDTASLEPNLTLGLCTAVGGLTSHTAILARTLGLPAVVGLGEEAIAALTNGDLIILNGTEGTILAKPSAEQVEHYQQQASAYHDRFARLLAAADADAHTADGHRVEVAANIGDLESAQSAVEFRAEGVGLLRTEFLYLGESQPPSEERQVEIYRAIFEALDGRPIVVRTLDIGGDKPADFIAFEEELNPFLGWRAIRMCLDMPDLFKTQLRAILRAAHGHNIWMMFPMISGLAELRQAKQIVVDSQAELASEGLEFASDIKIGIMVETPSAALIADQLAQECDFLSIGTNDLTQYTLAVDRTNNRVAKLFQPLHPAVLRAIKMTIDAGHRHEKWVGMCGELAGTPKAIPILLGLGLDEFSMVPRAIPEAKWLISRLTIEQAHWIAEQALQLATAAEINTFMEEQLSFLTAE